MVINLRAADFNTWPFLLLGVDHSTPKLTNGGCTSEFCRGAAWIQGFVAFQWPDAVHLLNFPHAASYVAQAGQAVYGEGTAACSQWFTVQRQALRHGDPGGVLQALRRLATTAKRREATTVTATVAESLGYLAKRRGMLDYTWFDARGFPIGSGSVESAKTLVVERRLKGAGMHWARGACQSDGGAARDGPQHGSGQGSATCTAPSSVSPQPGVLRVAPAPCRPPSDHLWRRFPISWKSTQQTTRVTVAKL